MQEIKKIIFMILGIFFITLGFLGIVLPIIPGIPFFLIGILFLAKGSKKFIKWLLSNKYIGKYIRKFRKEGISDKVRNLTLVSVWVTHILSIIFIKIITVKIILMTTLILVTWVLLVLKIKKNQQIVKINEL